MVFRSRSRNALNGCASLIAGSFAASSFEPIEGEEDLHLHRLLAPQRAVIVERRDPLSRMDEVRAAILGHAGDEVEDRALDDVVVPRGQGVADWPSHPGVLVTCAPIAAPLVHLRHGRVSAS